jgi:glycosyltransferase involved in cell wall biosynthesis
MGENAPLGLDEALLHRVSVVIPTLNEADSIAIVLAGIPAAVREVIVVDGLSTDGTVEAATAARPGVQIVRQQVRGKGAAIRAGIEHASGDYVVLMDGDGSTDPTYLSTFARVLAGGADIAKGSRFLPGAGTDDMTFHRRIGNWCFVVLARALFGARFTDITYGYNAVRRDRAGAMALEIDGWAQEIVTNLRMVRYGMRVEEVPTFEPRRIAGVAKLRTWSAGWAILLAILVERRHPLQDLDAIQRPSLRNSGQPWVPVMVHASDDPDPGLRHLSDGSPVSLAPGLVAREREEPVNAVG